MEIPFVSNIRSMKFMVRQSWKRVLLVIVVVAMLLGTVDTANAWWRGYCGGWYGCYSSCYSSWDSCYTSYCYRPYRSCYNWYGNWCGRGCYSSCYSSGCSTCGTVVSSCCGSGAVTSAAPTPAAKPCQPLRRRPLLPLRCLSFRQRRPSRLQQHRFHPALQNLRPKYRECRARSGHTQ